MEGADSVFGTHLGVIGTVPGTSGWDFQKQQQEQRCVKNTLFEDSYFLWQY